MNYYPYFSYLPSPVSTSAPAATGLFSRLFRNGINWGGIINNTQKTLNIINQAIPVVKQVTPVVKNAKTMFRVMNEFKKSDSNTNANNSLSTEKDAINNQNINYSSVNSITNQQQKNLEGPTFFA